jgi:hypothetical protein
MADTDGPSLADQLRAALEAVPKGRTGREPSPLREHVRAVFDGLVARRKEGANWDALARVFADLGITTDGKRRPTGTDLRNAFHAERYGRGERRQRRPKPKPKRATPSPLGPLELLPEPGPPKGV